MIPRDSKKGIVGILRDFQKGLIGILRIPRDSKTEHGFSTLPSLKVGPHFPIVTIPRDPKKGIIGTLGIPRYSKKGIVGTPGTRKKKASFQ